MLQLGNTGCVVVRFTAADYPSCERAGYRLNDSDGPARALRLVGRPARGARLLGCARTFRIVDQKAGFRQRRARKRQVRKKRTWNSR